MHHVRGLLTFVEPCALPAYRDLVLSWCVRGRGMAGYVIEVVMCHADDASCQGAAGPGEATCADTPMWEYQSGAWAGHYMAVYTIDVLRRQADVEGAREGVKREW